MDEKDRQKTAFGCHLGLNQFWVMPFGLSGAPGILSHLMTIVLSEMEGFMIAYLNDILMFSKDPEENSSFTIGV